MVALFRSIIGSLPSAFRTRADLALENLALRQQLANLRRTSGRPHLRKADRAFWIVLSRLWSRWADVLVVVKPDTVVRLSLGKDSPEPRAVQPPSMGEIVEMPEVGGLHHRYIRQAA